MRPAVRANCVERVTTFLCSVNNSHAGTSCLHVIGPLTRIGIYAIIESLEGNH